jgi:hypothetical protein
MKSFLGKSQNFYPESEKYAAILEQSQEEVLHAIIIIVLEILPDFNLNLNVSQNLQHLLPDRLLRNTFYFYKFTQENAITPELSQIRELVSLLYKINQQNLKAGRTTALTLPGVLRVVDKLLDESGEDSSLNSSISEDELES